MEPEPDPRPPFWSEVAAATPALPLPLPRPTGDFLALEFTEAFNSISTLIAKLTKEDYDRP